MCWRLRAYSLPCDVICGESSRNVSVLFTIYVPMCSLTLSLNAFLSLKAAAACWNCNHSFAHVSKTYTVSGQGKYTCILVWFIGISTVYFSLPPSLSLSLFWTSSAWSSAFDYVSISAAYTRCANVYRSFQSRREQKESVRPNKNESFSEFLLIVYWHLYKIPNEFDNCVMV